VVPAVVFDLPGGPYGPARFDAWGAPPATLGAERFHLDETDVEGF